MIAWFPCRLEMSSAEAATQLCTCVFDCNVPLLRRYMKAGILVNAGNFDSRTALHVAAAEGNLAAVRPYCRSRPWSVSTWPLHVQGVGSRMPAQALHRIFSVYLH